MPQQYLSTDPQAGLAAAPPPTPSSPSPYLSTDPQAGVGGGRGGGPGVSKPATSGRGGGPGSGPPSAPPPREYYPGGWRAAGQDFAGAVGGAAAVAGATALLPEAAPVAGVVGIAKALPWAARIARGVIGVGGAAAGGAGAAALEGAPLTGGPEEDSIVHAAKQQAEYEASGLGAGWALSSLGRRAIASRVGTKAAEWLKATRDLHMEDVKGIFNRTQDAIRQHATAQATTKLARTEAIAPLEETARRASMEARGAGATAKATAATGAAQADQLRARWPQTEAAMAPPSATPPPALATTGPVRAVPAGVQDGFGGPDIPLYNVAGDASHPLHGSTVSEATLTAHGIPVPAHGSGAASAATPPPNFPARAAQQVADVVAGPAQRSLNQLGQAVEASTKTGPALDFAPIKAKLQAMHAQTQPAAAAEAGAGLPALSPDAQVGLARAKAQGLTEADFRAAIGKAGTPLEADHPLPGVLQTIADAPDTVSFEDAHKYKRLLDDAIGWKPAGAVRAPARGQLKQITKGVRGQIRDTMSVHAPYEQATSAYRDASTLFGPQGLARKIQAVAQTNPEALVNSLVKPSEPTKLQMLKDVLTDHAAAGGGEDEGRAAWQAVQSTVMYKHLIAPGIDKFDASVASMHPEFLHTLTGDPYARQVFDRLSQMSEAVKQVEAQTASQVVGHRAVQQAALGVRNQAQTATSMINQQGRQVDAQAALEGAALQTEKQRAGRAVTDARQPTKAEEAFGKSSLARPASAASVGSDLAYAAVAPPGSPRQVAGAVRLFLKGPKVNDLIRWASLSPTGTQMFVRAVTSPAPGEAIADLIRLHQWDTGKSGPGMAVGHQQGAGVTAPAAVPPPGPGR